MGDFERKMDSKGYRFLKIVADLFVVNFEFLFTVIFSLTFLLFPSLFALIELCKKEKETYVRPFKDYFELLKQNYSVGWKYWCVFTPIYALCIYSIYLSYQLIQSDSFPIMAWISVIVVVGILIALTSAIIHLALFRAYFGDETPMNGFKKASLIARKKIFLTATIWVTILIFAFVYYLFLPIVLILGFGILGYIIVSLADRFYCKLYREEQDRLKAIKEENNE